MIVVGGGGAFGASATTEGDSTGINEQELAGARDLGERVAEITIAVRRGFELREDCLFRADIDRSRRARLAVRRHVESRSKRVWRVGAFKLVFCQSYEFVDIFRTTTTAPMFTQAKLSYDLPSGQTALPTGFPHV